MIESAGYALIKQEGIQEGIQQGILQGEKKGQITASREALIDLLTERFDIVPQHLLEAVSRLENLLTLKVLRKHVLKVSSIETFETDMNRMIQ